MAFLGALTAFVSTLLLVQAPSAPEYQVKALFLFNFVQFVEWPAPAAGVERGPLLIGVLGDDPFGAVLDQTVRDERVGSRPIQVRRYRDVSEVGACDILFISRSENDRVPEILSALKGRAVLTVSDGDVFARRGGMIQFFNDRNRIRLRVNLEAAQTAHLTISSKLLRVAEIVGTSRR
jgi:hypothetical protein